MLFKMSDILFQEHKSMIVENICVSSICGLNICGLKELWEAIENRIESTKQMRTSIPHVVE